MYIYIIFLLNYNKYIYIFKFNIINIIMTVLIIKIMTIFKFKINNHLKYLKINFFTIILI